MTDPTPTPRNETEYVANLKLELSEAQRKYLNAFAVIKDDCDTDANVRALLRPILGKEGADHDGYAVVALEDAVGAILNKLSELQAKWDYVVAEERACCPEHVGFREYVARLEKQLAEAQQQLLNREQRWEESEGIRDIAERELSSAQEEISNLKERIENKKFQIYDLTRDKERGQTMLQRYEEKYGKLETD